MNDSVETKTILVLRGLQGSGKSTFAKQWISEDPDNRIRFNRDDIRNMFGKYWVPEREGIINQMYYTFLNEAMIGRFDIVIDNMNLNEKCITELQHFVDEFNTWIRQSELNIQYEMKIKEFFHVPLQTCIERDSKREHPVGERVIRNTFSKYKSKIAPWKYLN